jgi:peptidyl-tRNA hydrolase, PTH1 family
MRSWNNTKSAYLIRSPSFIFEKSTQRTWPIMLESVPRIMHNTTQKYRAIVGLGNPGAQYVDTRHNIGFTILDRLAHRYDALWQSCTQYEFATVVINGHKLLLVKPQTFMNHSGAIMANLLKKGIKPSEIIVVHDELEKIFGSLGLKEGGSHRGHNGLRSIIGAIGNNFSRIRFGIGRPPRKEDVPTYVLAQFAEPKEVVAQAIQNAVLYIERLFYA